MIEKKIIQETINQRTAGKAIQLSPKLILSNKMLQATMKDIIY